MREQVKWNFNNYAYTKEELNGCPQCKWEQSLLEGEVNVNETFSRDKSFAVHPETVALLCDKHYKEFREWHDKAVKKGNIESWFK